jgi:hypothetical protein
MCRVGAKPLMVFGLVVLLGVTGSNSGCGMIAEPDRIVIAKLDGKNITRRMLLDIIYDMKDDERPIVRSRKDYLRVLNQHIDRQIKIPLGQQMANEGKLTINRDIAREKFFSESGDNEEQYRHMWTVPVPKEGEETELMKIYNLRAVDIQAMKNIIEQETDRIVEEMQAEQAVQLLAMEAVQKGELTLDPEALQREYEVSKDTLRTYEGMTFLGLQFAVSDPQANEEAAKVRQRIDAGESFDKVLEEYLARDIRFGIESDIENNPSLTRFQMFWDQVSGAKEGDIFGPIYMPEYSRVRQDATGQSVQEIVPATYLVFKVLEYRPGRTLTIEEATPMLAGPIAYAAMMNRLREQHGVEVYEDKLPEVTGGDEDIFSDR